MPPSRSVMLCVIILLLPLSVGAAPVGPGWHQSAPPALAIEPVPATASTAQSSLAAMVLAPCNPACDPTCNPASNPPRPHSGSATDALLPEIQALAAGLHHDPVQIYAYVHNHITYEHYYGAKQGAVLTLLEGSGNDFDQSALLVALLRAAGHNAQYRFGTQSIAYQHADEPDLVEWLGLAPTAYPGTSWTTVLARNNLSEDPWPSITSVQRKKNALLATVFVQSRGTPTIGYEAE